MDFMVGLPRCQSGHDTIWVIVDRLTKSAHFLPIRNSDSLDKLAQLYVREIIILHGTLVSIVSDRDPRFTSLFGPSLQNALALNCISVRLFIHRRMANLRGLYRI